MLSRFSFLMSKNVSYFGVMLYRVGPPLSPLRVSSDPEKEKFAVAAGAAAGRLHFRLGACKAGRKINDKAKH